VNKANIQVAEDIFWSHIGILKGKTVRRNTGHVEDASPSTLPPDVINNYKQMTIWADIMFINKITFMVTILCHIRFGTCEVLISQSHYKISNALENVLGLYETAGFQVKRIHMDGQFEGIQEKLTVKRQGPWIYITSRDEHVPEAEPYIRTIKEQVRCVYNSLPFNKPPARMTS